MDNKGTYWKELTNEQWSNIQQVINDIKNAHELYIPNDVDPFVIFTDSSKKAIGWHLNQLVDGKLKSLAFGGRKFNKTELSYAITKKELLAIKEALKDNRNIIFGRQVEIRTDHKAWSNYTADFKVNTVIERWWQEIQEYSPVIKYIDGKSNTVADALSRLVYQTTINKSLSDEQIRIIIKNEHEMGHRSIHALHMTLKKRGFGTISKLRDIITDVVLKCPTCQQNSSIPDEFKFELKQFLPVDINHIWGIDILGPYTFDNNNNNKVLILIIVDYFSKWLELKCLKDMNTYTIISKLEKCIADKGKPDQIVSDMGTQFSSNQFKEWCVKNNIYQTIASTHHQQTNGQVERTVQTIKPMLMKSLQEHRNIDKTLNLVKNGYNNNIHSSIGCTPYEAMFGLIPKEIVKSRIIKNKIEQERQFNKSIQDRNLNIGDEIWTYNLNRKFTTDPMWNKPTSIQKIEDEKIFTADGRELNIQFIKKIIKSDIYPSKLLEERDNMEKELWTKRIDYGEYSYDADETSTVSVSENYHEDNEEYIDEEINDDEIEVNVLEDNELRKSNLDIEVAKRTRSRSVIQNKKVEIGDKVGVYKGKSKEWRYGTVIETSRSGSSTKVKYDDGTEEIEDFKPLSNTQWKYI